MQAPVNLTPEPLARARRRRRNPRMRDADATRDRLVAAAAEVFNRDGYHATDSNRIARAAGYAPASFYKHFRDKREIFLAAYSQWVETEWATIQREWAAGASRASRPRRIVRAVVEHHRRWAGFRRSLRALADTDEAVRVFRQGQRDTQLAFLRALTHGAASAARRADDLWTLLVFERICDAIADGETAALGVPEAPLLRRLEALVDGVTPARRRGAGRRR